MGITALISGLFESIGVGSTVAGIGATLVEGAALGAGTSAISGGNIGLGALTGGLTMGLGGVAGSALESLGLGISPALATIGGDVLGGLATSAITGQSLGKGALGGLEAGVLSSALGGTAKPFGGSTPAAPAPGGGTSSAAAAAAPPGIAATDPSAVAAAASGGVTAGGTGLPGSGGGGTGLPGSVGGGAAAGGSAGGPASTGVTEAGSVPGLPAANSTGAITTDAGAATTTGLNSNFDATFGTGAGGTSAPSSLAPGASHMGPTDLLAGTPYDTSAAAALGGAAPAAAAAPGGGGFMKSLTSNPMMAMSMLGMGANLLGGNKPSPYSANLTSAASSLTTQGSLMESYLSSGTLPPGLQTGIDQATQAAHATIKSQYAARGMSGSSAEAQDLQAVTERASAQGAQLAIQLYSQGVQETQLGDQIYAQLMQAQTTQDNQASAAISNFAGAMAGMASRPQLAAAA